MWRLLNHQIEANIIFKVSRLSVAELVNTFAQLLRAGGLVSSSIQEYPVPSLLTRTKTLRVRTLEKKNSCLFWSKKRVLNLSFTSLGKEEISFINEDLLTLLSYEYFLNDFKIHCIKLWIFAILGEWEALGSCLEARWMPRFWDWGGGVCPTGRDRSIVLWGLKIKSSRKPQVISTEQFQFEAILSNNCNWVGMCSIHCWISFCSHSNLTKIFSFLQF